MTLPVVLIGAAGRLGRHVDSLLGRQPGFEVVARLGRGEVTPGRIAETGAVVGLEMTTAGQGLTHGLALLQGGVRPVLATSGVTEEQTTELDREARRLDLGGLVVPNFSLGILRLQKLAQELVGPYPRVEIIETHHIEKADAPSGTSLHTRELLEGRSGDPERPSTPIHSLRLPGAQARQEIVFGGPGEILRLSHEVQGPEAYDEGVLRSLRYAETAVGVRRGLEGLLGGFLVE